MTNFYSNNDRGFSLLMIVENVGTPNIANNTSDVRARLYLRNTNLMFSGQTISGSMSVHTSNFTYNGTPSMLTTNSSILLLDKTITVTHNDDGTKYIAVDAVIRGQGGYSPNTLNLNGGAFDLPTIQRASTVTVNDLDIGSTMTINIARQSTNFTHTVRYNWNGKTGTIGTSVGTQTTWTVPLDFCNDAPNSDYYWGTVYVDTYNGSTLIGTKSAVFKGYVPSSVKPTLTSVTVSDSNSKASSLVAPNFVQIISQPTATVTGASGAYGSTIKTYDIQIVGKNQSTTTNGGSLGTMNWNGTATVQATVTDSRGRVSNPVTTTITVLEYKPPAFSFTAVRSGADKSLITVTRSATISPLTVGGVQKNKMVMQFKTAPVNTTTFTVDTSNASGTFMVAEMINQSATITGTYPVNASYDVYGLLSDEFVSSAEIKQTIGVEQFPFTWDRTGLGVGKVRQYGVLDVNGDIFGKDGILIGNYTNSSSITDFDKTLKAGFFQVGNSTLNHPSGNSEYGYLRNIVTSGATYNGTNNWIFQEFTTVSGKVFSRYKINAGAWSVWEDKTLSNYAKTTHTNLINSGWITLGNGFQYKRVGDLVSLYYDFTISNGATSLTVGTLPISLTPRRQMFRIASWDNNVNNYSIHIQVDVNGSVQWLNPSAFNKSYAGSVSWLI